MTRKAFTLVELLVVVTIIVILLAMLMPAMSKAVYQAQLLKCATNYKHLASASQTYAWDHKKWYPHRDLPKAPSTAPWPVGSPGVQPHKLTHPETGSGTGSYDLRPMLRPYITINDIFNDPFCQPLNYDNRDAAATTVAIYTSIFYWAGWHYEGRQGMSKIGDRFDALDRDEPWTGRTYRLGVLAGDIDTHEGQAYSSHPDNRYLNSRIAENAAWIESNWVGYAAREPLDLRVRRRVGIAEDESEIRLDPSLGRDDPYL